MIQEAFVPDMEQIKVKSAKVQTLCLQASGNAARS